MLEITEQRPLNNEYVNIITKPRGQPSDVIVPAFPLSGKRNYVVEEFSTEHQRATITSPPKVRRVVVIPCQFFIECTPTSYLV